MSLNIIAFGVEVALNGALVIDAFLPKEEKPVVQLGIGSRARGESGNPFGGTGGVTPTMQLYDSDGENFANYFGGEEIQEKENEKFELKDGLLTGLSGDHLKRVPFYMRILAHDIQPDPICITYVTVTSAGGDHRTWHAGYARQCDAAAWYPSPEPFPKTDLKPGCVWLSLHDNDRFLQAISFRLTDFAFPNTDLAERAKKQFEEFPATLCKSKGRMALWKQLNVMDCIPYYDFDDDEKDPKGFDKDFDRIQSGETIKCKLSDGAAFKNDELDFPLAVKVQNPCGPDAFGGTCGVMLPPAKCAEGSFGGTCGVQFGLPVLPEAEQTQSADPSVAANPNVTANPTNPTAPTGDPDDELTTCIPASEVAANPDTGLPICGGAEVDGANAGSTPQGQTPVQQQKPPLQQQQGADTINTPPAQGANAGSNSQPQPSVFNKGSQGAQIISINPGGQNGKTVNFGNQQAVTTTPPKTSRRARRALQIRSVLEHREMLRQKRDPCVDGLTISELDGHSASEVCGSRTSWGADFVAKKECLYCDMCTRQTWKLCGCRREGSEGKKNGERKEEYFCWDVKEKALRLPPHLRSRELQELKKTYRRVDHWK